MSSLCVLSYSKVILSCNAKVRILMTMTRHSLDTIRFLSHKAYEYFLVSQSCTICCQTLIDKIDISNNLISQI